LRVGEDRLSAAIKVFFFFKLLIHVCINLKFKFRC
jgi:hypothetical protein